MHHSNESADIENVKAKAGNFSHTWHTKIGSGVASMHTVSFDIHCKILTVVLHPSMLRFIGSTRCIYLKRTLLVRQYQDAADMEFNHKIDVWGFRTPANEDNGLNVAP
jgi:hypothetical protein